MPKKVYIVENLGCANCAAKIEKKILELPGIDEANIVFATRQLHLTADYPDQYLEQIEQIARSFEPDIVITERKHRTQGSAISSTICSGEETCCGHNHTSGSYSCSDHHHEQDCCCSHHHDEQDCCGGHHHNEQDCCSTHHHNVQKDSFSHAEHSHNHGESKKELLTILAGILFFIPACVMTEQTILSLGLFLTSYLILGRNVLKNAIAGCRNGHYFDENFLMSLATIGAFLIQEYPEAVGVMLFFRIGEFFEHMAVEKSRNSIMEAVDMRPETVMLVEGDHTIMIPASEALPGQIILVRAGDRIPLDGTLIEGSTRIDTSAVTGEPVPVSAGVGDALLSGCVNLSGTISMRIDKPLSESMVSRILECVENAAAGKPKMERFITRFSRIYTPFVVIGAAFTAIIPSIITGDWSYWIYTALTFLVISCPCALVLSVPLAFFSGIGAGSSKGILFKNGLSMEALWNIKNVVLDKTGTITKGTFEIEEIVPLTLSHNRADLISLFATCEMNSSHPIAGSILAYAKEQNIPYQKPDSTKELAGKGIIATLNGTELLCGNKDFLEEQGVDCSSVTDIHYGTEVLLASDKELIGMVHIEDRIKPESAKSIKEIHRLGLHTIMLTGDTEENARAIAQKTGIKEVHSRLLPEDKLTILKKIREKKGSVLFVGDGINDAPVLAGADVGAAMGNGADAAIEAADVIFMNKDLASIPEAIHISRAAIRTAKQNIIFALLVKALVLILGFLKYANMWFAVFADSGVALLCVINSVRVLYKYRKKS